MFLSNHKVSSLLLLLLATVSLTACGGTSQTPSGTSNTSEVTATMSLDDLVIQVDDAVPLNPVFNPISAASSVTYEIENEDIVSISRSGILLGLAEGVTNVTATSETDLTDTFQVTVNASDEDPVEQFNTYGQFEDTNIPGWILSGPTASLHIVEGDADRGQEDLQLKLFTGDFNAEDENASLIDMTLTLAYEGEFEAGDYTLVFDLVGVVNDVSLTLEGVTYTKGAGEILMSAGSYRSTYIQFSLASKKALSLSFTFYSPGTQTNWGYMDDVKLELGHTKPVVVVPEDGNLLSDGSFEVAGSQTEWLDEATNEYLDWQIAGTLRTGEEVTLNSWAGHEDYSLKYNFWPSASTDKGDVKVFQTFTLDTSTTLNLSYFVASGGITDSHLYIEVDGVEAYRVLIPNSGSYAQQTLNSISLPAGEVEFGVHIQEGFQTWIHLDYFLLTIAE